MGRSAFDASSLGALEPPVRQPWDQGSSNGATAATYDPETSKFLTAWRRIYSSPLLHRAWFPGSTFQSNTSTGADVQSSAAVAPNFSFAPTASEEPTTAATSFNKQQRASLTPLPSSGSGENNWEAGLTPFGLGTGSTPGGPPAPVWDANRPGATARPSQLFPGASNLWSWGDPEEHTLGTGQSSSGGDGQQSRFQILSDETPDNYWIPGADYAGVGHHHIPREVFRKLPLPEETRKVFEKATTGPLPFNGWHRYDELHRLYSAAAKDLVNNFMQERSITAQQMTPDRARLVLEAIAGSKDPRIEVYRAMLQHMGRLYRLRSGARGSE